MVLIHRRLSVRSCCFSWLARVVYVAASVCFYWRVLTKLRVCLAFRLSSTITQMLSLIQGFRFMGVLPKNSSHVQTIVCFIPPKSYFTLGFYFVSFLRTIWFLFWQTSRWWSETISAPRLTLTSWRELLKLCFIMMWSIWFSVWCSGDTNVSLWHVLCGNSVPPTIRLFMAQKSIRSYPFSSILSFPCHCHPISLSLSVLLLPNLAFRSPIKTSMSIFRVLTMVACSWA